jgi:hypothetical protein
MTTEERLLSLEKELAGTNRRNRNLFIGLLVLAVASMATFSAGTVKAQSDGTLLQAEKFQILDYNGYVRAELSMDDGGPKLIFYDGIGIPRASLDGYSSGPALTLYDNIANVRAAIAVPEDTDDAYPGLFLYDHLGNPIWTAP